MEQQSAKCQSDLISIAKDYIENMLSDCQGRKALVMDQETLIMVSLVYSRTEILQKEVFLICTLDQMPQEQLTHLKCVIFCRATQDNIQIIKQEVSNSPKFSQYNIYFSNKVEIRLLKSLAESDSLNIINQVQELYLDYQAVNSQLFSLEMPSSIYLSRKTKREWNSQDESKINRIADSLFSILMSIRASNPRVRYDQSSEICTTVAQELDSKIYTDKQYFEQFQNSGSLSGNTTVLILDRKADPITPLLNQWTYQAMIHELLGISRNRVDLKHVQNLSEEMKEVTISSENDEFYSKIMFSNFGDVADAIHNLVQSFLKNKKSVAQFNTIEDMQRIIENFPEFKKGERNTTKHFNILEELRKQVDSNSLYEVSEIEQEIVSGPDGKNKHFKSVQGLLEKDSPSINNTEAIRIVMLFTLRYDSPDQIKQLKSLLKQRNISDEKLKLIDHVIDYSGKQKRKGELFSSSMINNTKRFLNSMFGEDVKNVLLQHKSWLSGTILDQYVKGKLDTNQYPYFEGGKAQNEQLYEERNYGTYQTLIVFFIGGATYEEAKEVALFSKQPNPSGAQAQFQQIAGQALGNLGAQNQFNQNQIQPQNLNIIFGGTTIHNSKSFLKEVQDLYNEKSNFQSLEIQ